MKRWLIFHAGEKSTRPQWLRLARKRLAPHHPSAAFVSGTNAYFAELNRERPDPAALDGACFCLNPQVHAFDNDSLIENLAAQASALESARQFVGNLQIFVTPVTLTPRFNPNATAPEPPRAPGELPAQVDPRQMSLLGAGWTLGSMKYLAESGAAAVTCFETTGWRGVMETERGSPFTRPLPLGLWRGVSALPRPGGCGGIGGRRRSALHIE